MYELVMQLLQILNENPKQEFPIDAAITLVGKWQANTPILSKIIKRFRPNVFVSGRNKLQAPLIIGRIFADAHNGDRIINLELRGSILKKLKDASARGSLTFSAKGNRLTITFQEHKEEDPKAKRSKKDKKDRP